MRLQELITTRKKKLRLTYDDLISRSEAAGYPISRSMWHHFITKDWPNVPTTDSLRGIAAAIELDPNAVLDAAAESVRIREVGLGSLSPSARAVVALLADRPEAQAAALEAVLRSVIDAMDFGGGTAPAPCDPQTKEDVTPGAL